MGEIKWGLTKEKLNKRMVQRFLKDFTEASRECSAWYTSFQVTAASPQPALHQSFLS